MELQASTWSPWDAPGDSGFQHLLRQRVSRFPPKPRQNPALHTQKKGFKHWMEQEGAAFPALQGTMCPGGQGWGVLINEHS